MNLLVGTTSSVPLPSTFGVGKAAVNQRVLDGLAPVVDLKQAVHSDIFLPILLQPPCY